MATNVYFYVVSKDGTQFYYLQQSSANDKFYDVCKPISQGMPDSGVIIASIKKKMLENMSSEEIFDICLQHDLKMTMKGKIVM